MISEQAESYISEYALSDQFLFLDSTIKERAEEVLQTFFAKAAEHGVESLEGLPAKTVEAVLFNNMGKLALPAAAKRAIPGLLEGFFGYLKDTGRFPSAGSWQICIETVSTRFQNSIREDGSARGETFRKTYSETGRNDPCPCGSGKKFKKCCGPLIGI